MRQIRAVAPAPTSLSQEATNVNVLKAANGAKVQFAREQRSAPTVAEGLLWEQLRASKLGYKFRRQHPFDLFVLDFYCDVARLVVEVDGPLHEGREDYDCWRDQELQRRGLWVLRFRSEQVEADPLLVAEEIREAVVRMVGGGVAGKRDVEPFPSPERSEGEGQG